MFMTSLTSQLTSLLTLHFVLIKNLKKKPHLPFYAVLPTYAEKKSCFRRGKRGK